MSGERGGDAVPEQVAERLRALAGVQEVDVSGLPGKVVIRSDAAGTRSIAAELVRPLLQTEFGLDAQVRIETGQGSGRSGNRVRFESLDVKPGEPGRVTARLTLGLNGKKYVGESNAESGLIGELRASGTATIKALGNVVGDEAGFALVGIKEVHVFDHDVVAVLVHSPKLPDRRMIGLSIINEDRSKAAVFAVLNATNRAVGSLTGSGGS